MRSWDLNFPNTDCVRIESIPDSLLVRQENPFWPSSSTSLWQKVLTEAFDCWLWDSYKLLQLHSSTNQRYPTISKPKWWPALQWILLCATDIQIKKRSTFFVSKEDLLDALCLLIFRSQLTKVTMTVQTIHEGLASGNFPFKANVVLDLYKCLEIDAVAGVKLRKRLSGEESELDCTSSGAPTTCASFDAPTPASSPGCSPPPH